MTRIFKLGSGIALLLIILSGGIRVHAQDLQVAQKLTRAERFDDANAAFQTLLKQNPNDGDVYYYYGENYLQEYYSDTTNNSFKELSDLAGNLFVKGTTADPADPLNYVGIGQIALMLRDMTKSQQNFGKALSLLPSKANKGLVMSPEKHATVYIKIANAFIKAGVNDTATVFNFLRTAEKLDPKNYDLYIVKGDAYIFLLNDGSKAIQNYNIAQSLNPKSPFAKLRVGQLWMRARNYKDALIYYQEVVKIDSTFAPAYRELGYLLSRANRNDEAQQNYKKFLRLSGGNTTARIQYVNTLIELKNYNEAIVQLNEILKNDTSNNDLNRALAYSYFETGQYDKGLLYSKKFFRRADLSKVRATDFAYLGRLLAKTKQDSLAHEMLLKAFKMDTSHSELLSEAAMSMIKLKKYDKAIDIYNMKITVKKIVPNDYYNLGKVYYNVKSWGKVDTTLAYYSTLMPDHVQGYLWRARALVNIDTTSKLGLAKPVYEIMIEKARVDSLKNAKELMEAYSYLAYYYLVQFKETKDQQYGLKSIDYCNKVLAIIPPDPGYTDKAKAILKDLEPKIKKQN
ncbi:MAG: tetratricopeptide repeat protein [Bacteroidetes bacterium]|nr:tetratricopeptide repeat protein [Bacteroidota bacterium]